MLNFYCKEWITTKYQYTFHRRETLLFICIYAKQSFLQLIRLPKGPFSTCFPGEPAGVKLFWSHFFSCVLITTCAEFLGSFIWICGMPLLLPVFVGGLCSLPKATILWHPPPVFSWFYAMGFLFDFLMDQVVFSPFLSISLMPCIAFLLH